MRIGFVALVAAVLSGCASMRTKVDPTHEYSTDSGFRFRFAMAGEWHEETGNNGLYVVSKKPGADGTTQMALVRHGPIVPSDGQTLSNQRLLDGFQRDLVNDAKGGRAANVKSHFIRKTYKGADCMSFDQIGEDRGAPKPMVISNDGFICLHPKRPNDFIWMSVSERRPLGKKACESFESDKKQLYDSLEFF